MKSDDNLDKINGTSYPSRKQALALLMYGAAAFSTGCYYMKDAQNYKDIEQKGLQLLNSKYPTFNQKIRGVELDGTTYATCQGVYEVSSDTLEGAPIWDRTTLNGQSDTSRFAFKTPDGYWCITGSQWRDAIVESEHGGHGAFECSTGKADNFEDSLWKNAEMKDQTVELVGSTYATCQGEYVISSETLDGSPIWDRTTLNGVSDTSRFAFKNNEGKWCITGSQWRDGIVKSNSGGHGAFACSTDKADNFEDTLWEGAYIKDQTVELVGTTYATCQGEYVISSDLLEGTTIWDRTTLNGEIDQSRFAFRQTDGKWCITGSQWRDEIVKSNSRNHGSFECSTTATENFEDSLWKNAEMK